ncbi:hypothetical protein BRADI_1g36972v3 [Brachypodium distachyon]|uniref:Uncharacterized protein n=1 Tax=Brachypodium distachyon TaxID=15368 RepID=A0A2K2DN61_BRADI|nr:hypothetical protein BRADI_1g36972v3 [Brachypodium distachyon]
MAFELDAICATAIASLITFPQGFDLSVAGVGHRATFWPSPLGLVSPLLAPPGDSALDGITDQVEQVTINEQAGVVRSLFTAPPPSVLGPTPAPSPRSTAPAIVAPRRSARQAGKISTMPVAQRATLRLAKELGVIDQEEQRADIAATDLTQRLKDPLSEVDVDGLAIMTRLDRETLLRAATQASSTRAATPAH